MKFEAGKLVRTRLTALVWRRWRASESRQEEWKGRVDVGIWESELPGPWVGKHSLPQRLCLCSGVPFSQAAE